MSECECASRVFGGGGDGVHTEAHSECRSCCRWRWRRWRWRHADRHGLSSQLWCMRQTDACLSGQTTRTHARTHAHTCRSMHMHMHMHASSRAGMHANDLQRRRAQWLRQRHRTRPGWWRSRRAPCRGSCRRDGGQQPYAARERFVGARSREPQLPCGPCASTQTPPRRHDSAPSAHHGGRCHHRRRHQQSLVLDGQQSPAVVECRRVSSSRWFKMCPQLAKRRNAPCNLPRQYPDAPCLQFGRSVTSQRHTRRVRQWFARRPRPRQPCSWC
jgi:hypothetical protein